LHGAGGLLAYFEQQAQGGRDEHQAPDELRAEKKL